jgi:hypothetical protein
MFALGFAVGALVIYKKEETVLTTLFNECTSLRSAEKELREERDAYRTKLETLKEIEDLPEYLKGKYYVPGTYSDTFTETETDDPEIYV